MSKSTLAVLSVAIGIILGLYLTRYAQTDHHSDQFQALAATGYNNDFQVAMDNDHLAEGSGKINWPNGNQYRGEFKNGMMHGQGELVYANGDTYKGGFSEGQLHGEGQWTTAQPDDAVHSYSGEWLHGDLIAAQGDLTIYSPETIAEHALYHQSTQLEQALSAVRPGRDDRIELFTLALGSYGSQEVFRREINFLESHLPTQFRQPEHTLFLSNSRRNLEDRPLVTLTSIQKSLQTLASNMNTDQDILLLYLTSHGSPNHTIAIEQPGLKLADLSPQKLRELLDASGIKWRVVILSACYSGGFIDSLQDDNTLIITAAAADKTSFGCTDNSDFTYFGEAFFKEALPQSSGFIEAFKIAEQRIKAWEQREDKISSEPQLFAGNQISAKLEAWRQQNAD